MIIFRWQLITVKLLVFQESCRGQHQLVKEDSMNYLAIHQDCWCLNSDNDVSSEVGWLILIISIQMRADTSSRCIMPVCHDVSFSKSPHLGYSAPRYDENQNLNQRFSIRWGVRLRAWIVRPATQADDLGYWERKHIYKEHSRNMAVDNYCLFVLAAILPFFTIRYSPFL